MKRRLPKVQFRLLWPRRIQEFTYRHDSQIRRGVKYFLVTVFALYLAAVGISQARISQREQYLPYQLASTEHGNFFSYKQNQVYYDSYSSTGGNLKFLLVHGFGASSLNWEYQIDYLRQHGEVVAVDLMGFGLSQDVNQADVGAESQAEMLNQLILHLGWPKAVLVGHSMGGGVSMRLALNHPQHVQALILVDSVDLGGNSGLLTGQTWLNGVFAAQIPLGLADAKAVMRNTLAAAVYSDEKITDRWVDIYFRSFSVKGATANLVAHGLAERSNRLAELGKITQPILLVRGEQDTFVPAEQFTNLELGLPAGYEQAKIPDAGHNPHEELPVVFNQVIGEWIGRKLK